MRRVGLIDNDVPPDLALDVFVCPHCGKEYKTEAALRTHCKKMHPDAFDVTDKED